MSAAAGERWGRREFALDPATLARRLIGARLVRVERGRRLSGIIVETEAYLGVRDRAAHSFGGRRTARTEPMYGQAGTAYVYFTYGMHHCMNVVAGAVDEPVAVLLRALAPEEGIGVMRRRREGAARDTLLCAGPGRLCQAMGIDRALSGVDMAQADALFVEHARDGAAPALRLARTVRIGVEGAGEPAASRLLRWCVRGSPHVSRPAR
jgi:DNA-3-methyladenine glycosylase